MSGSNDSSGSAGTIDFGRLCGNFLTYFDDYSKFVKKATFLRDPSVMNWVMFGVSGAGKSTTVARLLEDTSADTFWEDLQTGMAKESSTVTRSGVRIGHEVNSCTVVPTPFEIQQGNSARLFITDMPGFAETQAEKRISIDILLKCYMTTVKKFRLLIVVQASTLWETRLQTLHDHYHDALWNLFGDDYQKAIPHFYFVVTKMQETSSFSQSFEDRLKESMLELAMRNSDPSSAMFVQFLGMMLKQRVVVDLTKHDNVSLMEDIQTMITQGDDENAGLHIQSFDVVQLAAGENKLNQLCANHLTNSALVRQKELIDKSDVLAQEWKKTSEDLDGKTKELRERKRQADEKTEVQRKKLEAIQAEVKMNPESRALLVTEKEAAKKRLEVSKEKRDLFKNDNKDGKEFVDVRIDAAIEVSGGAMRAKKYVSEINADVCECKEDVIIVMDYEQDNKTLKNFIGRDGSLIPDSIKAIESIDVPSVLYNSKTQVIRGGCKVERPPQRSNEGLRWVKIKRDKPFKVYIFTSRVFSSMPFFQKLAGSFDKEVTEEQATIRKLDGQIKQKDAKLEQDKEKRSRLIQEVSVLEGDVKAVIDDVDELLKVYTKTTEDALANLREAKEDITKLKDDTVINQIAEVINILRTNKVQTHASPILDKFNEKFKQMLHDVATTTTRVESFKESMWEIVSEIKTNHVTTDI